MLRAAGTSFLAHHAAAALGGTSSRSPRGAVACCRPLPAAGLLLEPVAQRLADVVARLAGGLDRVLHAPGVVRRGGLGLLAGSRLLAAARVLAVDDAVVGARADPREQLVRAADGQRVAEVE